MNRDDLRAATTYLYVLLTTGYQDGVEAAVERIDHRRIMVSPGQLQVDALTSFHRHCQPPFPTHDDEMAFSLEDELHRTMYLRAYTRGVLDARRYWKELSHRSVTGRPSP